MRTNQSGIKPSAAAGARQLALQRGCRLRCNAPLLRELLAEAHARIRALEEALDRVKNAV